MQHKKTMLYLIGMKTKSQFHLGHKWLCHYRTNMWYKGKTWRVTSRSCFQWQLNGYSKLLCISANSLRESLMSAWTLKLTLWITHATSQKPETQLKSTFQPVWDEKWYPEDEKSSSRIATLVQDFVYISQLYPSRNCKVRTHRQHSWYEVTASNKYKDQSAKCNWHNYKT